MRPRCGVALACAVLAIVLVTALLAALFFTVDEDTRTGAAIDRRARGLNAAETALGMATEFFARQDPESSPIWSVQSHAVTADGIPAVVHITRLDSTLYWLVSVIGDPLDPAVTTTRIGLLATAEGGPTGSITLVRVPERAWSELF